ncbi:hypothetical protein CANARDRAFT_6062 [[Candida] arabinofermentans NRRL YB-2248]|uniref:Conserved oligomeric Golgi complex subunit 2 n=1 Tax=[Candida] arabinofermentans NRRL YB-2248 TaxID=983967 RepID=A0A1E4T717_9ASCO|nr:hypothetical protein CANARDRAFT_6062 [[Candida] arabinofermentans NRRL YB-2248]
MSLDLQRTISNTSDIVNSTSNLLIDDDDDDGDDVSSSDNLEFYSNLTRESFQYNLSKLPNNDNTFNPSEFLTINYKYWSLDDLIKSLKSLLEEIDFELIELVNSDYLYFIQLGKSIDGSIDLIHNCKIDLNGYIKELSLNNLKINNDLELIDNIIEFKKKLNLFKIIINYLILLNEQIDLFNELINKFNFNDDINELTILFLSINKIFSKLIKFKDSIDFLNILYKKINGLRFEFKSLLNDYLLNLKNDDSGNDENKLKMLELMKIYNILDERSSFFELIKK